MEALVATDDEREGSAETVDGGAAFLAEPKEDPGKLGMETLLKEISTLGRARDRNVTRYQHRLDRIEWHWAVFAALAQIL